MEPAPIRRCRHRAEVRAGSSHGRRARGIARRARSRLERDGRATGRTGARHAGRAGRRCGDGATGHGRRSRRGPVRGELCRMPRSGRDRDGERAGHPERRRRGRRLPAPDRPHAVAPAERARSPGPAGLQRADIEALVAYVASLGHGAADPERPGRRRDGHGSRARGVRRDLCRVSRRRRERRRRRWRRGRPAAARHVAPTQVGEAIRIGPGVMPRVRPDQVSDEQLAEIAAYLQFLGRDEAAPGGQSRRRRRSGGRGLRRLDRLSRRAAGDHPLDRAAEASRPMREARSERSSSSPGCSA